MGKLIWQKNYVKDFGCPSSSAKPERPLAQSRHGYTASPLVDGEHLIAEVGGAGAGVVCFDKNTGSVIWKSQDDMPGYATPIIATVAGARQMLSFTAIAVIGLDVDSGKLLWRLPVKTALGRHAASPVVVGDMVLVSSHQAGLLGIKITQAGGAIKADLAWTSKESAINYASPVAVGDYLYGVGPGKKLICVDVRTERRPGRKRTSSPVPAARPTPA